MPVPLRVGIGGWGTKEEVSRSGGGGRVPELRGAAAGGDLGDGRSTGGLERVEGVVDLAGGLVVFEARLIWLRVRPAGLSRRAAWICSASGWPVAPWSAQPAERAA